MRNGLTMAGLGKVVGIRNATQQAIIRGLSKKCASTGTPINNLHGAARQNAQMSNIGGGSKAIGGKGMIGGLKTIINNERSNAVLKTINKMNGHKRIPNR